MSTTGRDYQKSKLYRFEEKFIAPLDRSNVPISQAQVLVDYVWKELGYKFPPIVKPLHKNSKKGGTANRHEINLQSFTPTWIILHEMAHSLTMMPDHLSYNDEMSAHGEKFVGAYLMLLERFMNIPLIMMLTHAKQYGLEFEVFTRAAFED